MKVTKLEIDFTHKKSFPFRDLLRSPNFWVLIVLILGSALRLVAFVKLLPGLNQDEASIGYEAYSLFHTGFDRWGKDYLPVYLSAWGSGQNVLPAYLIAPVVGWFGISNFTIRIFPFLMNLSLQFLFLIYMRKVYRHKGWCFALVGLFLFALNPWHIMVSTWNIDL